MRASDSLPEGFEFDWLSRLDRGLAECPVWDDRRQVCWWVDIDSGDLHRTRPEGEDDRWHLGRTLGMVALLEDGRLLVGVETRLEIVDPDSGLAETLIVLPCDPARTRINDGKIGPDGTLWVGTMSIDASSGGGTLYHFDALGELHAIVDPVSISNGLGWSPGGVMYYVDSYAHGLDTLSIDPGEAVARRRLCDIPFADGLPDGLSVDANGNIWVALYGGGALRVFDPAGRIIGDVPVPGAFVTSCAFGGADGLDLFVTVASRDGAGGLLRMRAGVAGVPVDRMKVADHWKVG